VITEPREGDGEQGLRARRVARAALLSVGDELLQGRVTDTNAPYLATRLAEAGVPTVEVRVLGDAERPLAQALTELARTHQLVIVSGGLGPTLDDVTRQAVARALGVELVESAAARAELARWCARVGRELSPANLRQALLPRGAQLVTNPAGSAPGLLCELGGALLACLPGPPRELDIVWRSSLWPLLEPLLVRVEARASARLFLFGVGESELAGRLGERMQRDANPLLGVTFSEGVLSLGLSARAEDEPSARALLEACLAELRPLLEPWLFSEESAEVEQAVGRTLLAAGRSVALAESCTAGLASALLSRVPGISAVLAGGFVTYADAAKVESLGVAPELIERHGAVSLEVASAMAAGAARAAGAERAVAITGRAGPGGGSPEKPVGLVCFGVWDGHQASAQERRFGNLGRELVRARAARTALLLLARAAAEDGADQKALGRALQGPESPPPR